MDGGAISSPRGPLADFLTARRAVVTAADHGLPEPGYLRRVAGLRREEVAHLAGISTDYYSRLEQGRVRTASRKPGLPGPGTTAQSRPVRERGSPRSGPSVIRSSTRCVGTAAA